MGYEKEESGKIGIHERTAEYALPAVKLLVLTADPASVVTVIGPLPAPAGTMALRSVEAVTEPLTGAAPLKVTVVPPTMKLAP